LTSGNPIEPTIRSCSTITVEKPPLRTYASRREAMNSSVVSTVATAAHGIHSASICRLSAVSS